MSGCWRGHQPRKRGSSWMSSVRYGVALSSIAPSMPWVRGSGPIDAISSSLMPGDQEAPEAARAVGDAERCVARADELARRVHQLAAAPRRPTGCAATASTASLTALSAGLSRSAICSPDDRPACAGRLALVLMPRHWYLDAGRDPRVRARGHGDRDHQARLDRWARCVTSIASSVPTDPKPPVTALRRAIELARGLGARLRSSAPMSRCPTSGCAASRSTRPTTCSGWSTRTRTCWRCSRPRPSRGQAAGVERGRDVRPPGRRRRRDPRRRRGAALGPDRGRQQGDDRRQAVPARVRCRTRSRTTRRARC